MKRRFAVGAVLLALFAVPFLPSLPRPAPLREGIPFSRAVYAREKGMPSRSGAGRGSGGRKGAASSAR
ncbi:MAG: hypothetical protein NUW21_14870, partial [Elusimicrobia bacterium]|nr:hypothetical protein [Elusimicrobiota bacterium]